MSCWVMAVARLWEASCRRIKSPAEWAARMAVLSARSKSSLALRFTPPFDACGWADSPEVIFEKITTGCSRWMTGQHFAFQFCRCFDNRLLLERRQFNLRSRSLSFESRNRSCYRQNHSRAFPPAVCFAGLTARNTARKTADPIGSRGLGPHLFYVSRPAGVDSLHV